MSKYHVALSFTGEDRSYVEKVAKHTSAFAFDVYKFLAFRRQQPHINLSADLPATEAG